MNYTVGDLLYHIETSDYLLITDITGNRTILHWLRMGISHQYHIDDLQYYFISL